MQPKQLPQELPTFGQAFKAAREAGLKIFEWRGKKFNTNLKEEQEAVNKSKRENPPITKKENKQVPTIKNRVGLAKK